MREFIDGNTATVRGALAAGCTFFAGYPITPASGILMAMMREQAVRSTCGRSRVTHFIVGSFRDGQEWPYDQHNQAEPGRPHTKLNCLRRARSVLDPTPPQIEPEASTVPRDVPPDRRHQGIDARLDLSEERSRRVGHRDGRAVRAKDHVAAVDRHVRPTGEEP